MNKNKKIKQVYNSVHSWVPGRPRGIPGFRKISAPETEGSENLRNPETEDSGYRGFQRFSDFSSFLGDFSK